MEDDSLALPKVPVRKLSSHNYVVKFKKNQFEAHKNNRDKLNQEELQQSIFSHKTKLPNSKTDIKCQRSLLRNDNDSEGDERNNFNWRPLRDFF